MDTSRQPVAAFDSSAQPNIFTMPQTLENPSHHGAEQFTQRLHKTEDHFQHDGPVRGSYSDLRSKSYGNDDLFSHFPPSYRASGEAPSSAHSNLSTHSSNEAASSQSSIFTRSNNTTPDEFGFDQSTRHFIESSKLTEALDVMSSYIPPPHPPSNAPAYDVNQLNRIEQSINSFWLVSENRLSIVQQELHAIACQVGSVQHIQEEANARVSDVVALQVEITQKTVNASQDRKMIFDRLKELEETNTANYLEMKKTLEAMLIEFREGMRTVIELAPKCRREQLTKVKAEKEGGKESGGKASPPSKKNTANAKKRKTQPEGEVVPSAPVVSSQPLVSATPPLPKAVVPSQEPSQSHDLLQVQEPLQHQGPLQIHRPLPCYPQSQSQYQSQSQSQYHSQYNDTDLHVHSQYHDNSPHHRSQLLESQQPSQPTAPQYHPQPRTDLYRPSSSGMQGQNYPESMERAYN